MAQFPGLDDVRRLVLYAAARSSGRDTRANGSYQIALPPGIRTRTIGSGSSRHIIWRLAMTRFVSASPFPDHRARSALGSTLLGRAVARAALLLATTASALAAQAGTIAGVVVAEGSLTPISEAQVRVTNATTGTTTDAAGRFRLTGLTGTNVSLEVRRLGYRPTTITANVGTMDLRIQLPEKRV